MKRDENAKEMMDERARSMIYRAIFHHHQVPNLTI
jgi:hypothetical protein